MTNSLSKKFHMTSISMFQIYLKGNILEGATSDESILQVQEELLASPIKERYEGYRIDEDGMLLLRLTIPPQ